MSLTNKQAAFCREYIIDLNATQAAIRAGYSAKTANNNTPQLMGNNGIRAEIDRLQAEKAERTALTADWIVCKIREEAEDRTPMGSSQSGRLKALELLGKHLGMFRDKLEVTGKDGGAITVSLTPDQRAEALAEMFALAAARLKPEKT